ncbi:unnamed protein product [Protopolystoma xenopodis]|uniref:Uncharacterized protein n=1 Tax=Protopolystoma xenopodis TaxID=117903 RepID=A0A3S5AZ87_9PLAT|nr:unnamed protein product [Protopolystoma xenopodis]
MAETQVTVHADIFDRAPGGGHPGERLPRSLVPPDRPQSAGSQLGATQAPYYYDSSRHIGTPDSGYAPGSGARSVGGLGSGPASTALSSGPVGVGGVAGAYDRGPHPASSGLDGASVMSGSDFDPGLRRPAGQTASIDRISRSAFELDIPDLKNVREGRERSRQELRVLNERFASHLEVVSLLHFVASAWAG